MGWQGPRENRVTQPWHSLFGLAFFCLGKRRQLPPSFLPSFPERLRVQVLLPGRGVNGRGLAPSFHGCQDGVHLLWGEAPSSRLIWATPGICSGRNWMELEGQLGTMDPYCPAGMGIMEGGSSPQ